MSHASDGGVGWRSLERELASWRAAGRRATLWLRDDDACRDSPALQRLLGIGRMHAVPLAVAAIPAKLEPSLAPALHACASTEVLQHGYAHVNHAAPGERSCELGAQRGVEAVLRELASGRDALAATFGDRFVAALVPPWNRIAPEIVDVLPRAGLRGLSTFGPRERSAPVTGLLQCNSHVDLIAWRHGRTYIGDERALARIVEHLAARREGRVDAGEATGILTHHLDMDDVAFAFVDALVARTRGAADWLGARTLFATARR
jgi:hypothetical protein